MRASLHARLREATAGAHQALERDLDWEARTATLSGYRDLLARMRGFHAGFEPAIGKAVADEDFFGPRRRLGHLDADLRRLGLEGAAIQALPTVLPIAMAGPAAGLGALYVLEGSTLGGQQIGRSIVERHGPDVERACSYYLGYGRAIGPMWNDFRARLDTLSDSPAAAEALDAGVATFDALRVWLTRTPRS